VCEGEGKKDRERKRERDRRVGGVGRVEEVGERAIRRQENSE